MSFFIDIPILRDIANALINFGNWVYNGLVWLANIIVSGLSFLLEKIKESAMWLWNQIAGAIKSFVDWVVGMVTGFVNQVSISVSTLLNNAFNYASGVINNILQGIMNFGLPWLSATTARFARASVRSLSTYYALKGIRSAIHDDMPRFLEKDGFVGGTVKALFNALLKPILSLAVGNIIERIILDNTPSFGFYTEPPTPPPTPEYITISAIPGVPSISGDGISLSLSDTMSMNDIEAHSATTYSIAPQGSDSAGINDSIYISVSPM